MADLISLAA